MITATRTYHFSYGHTVSNHMLDGKPGHCGNCHGHNGQIEWTISAPTLSNGMVLDFAVMKQKLDMWVENNWDHRFLIWENDCRAPDMIKIDPTTVLLDFNPTAENLAMYLLKTIGPRILKGTGAKLVHVKFYETVKCSVDVEA